PRRGRVLDAPVNGNDQKVAFGAGLFDRFEDLGLVRSRSAARLARIREEVHVRLVVLVGVTAAVEPARHAEPADLDAVGLDDDGLPSLLRRVSGTGEEQPFVAQMLAGFRESWPALVHYVVVGERNDLDAVGLQPFE